MCSCYIMYVIQYFYEHSIHNACYGKNLILFNILEILTISILGTYNAISLILICLHFFYSRKKNQTTYLYLFVYLTSNIR